MTDTKFWDEAALDACGSIFAGDAAKGGVVNIRADLDSFIDEFYNKPESDESRVAIENRWVAIAGDALYLNQNRAFQGKCFSLSQDDIVGTIIKKQRDYGHENIRRFGRQGLMIRCHDKVARLENLCGSDFEPNNESIDDTILDIVGYSTIGIMWERNEFLLPLAPPEISEKLLASRREAR